MSTVSTLASAAPAVLSTLAGLGGLAKGSRYVHEGERGVKLRFGRVIRRRGGRVKVIMPGFVFVARAILTAASAALRATALIDAAAKLHSDPAVAAPPSTVAAALIGTPVVTALANHTPSDEA